MTEDEYNDFIGKLIKDKKELKLKLSKAKREIQHLMGHCTSLKKLQKEENDVCTVFNNKYVCVHVSCLWQATKFLLGKTVAGIVD